MIVLFIPSTISYNCTFTRCANTLMEWWPMVSHVFCLFCFQPSFVFIPDAIQYYICWSKTHFILYFFVHHFAIIEEKVVNCRSKKAEPTNLPIEYNVEGGKLVQYKFGKIFLSLPVSRSLFPHSLFNKLLQKRFPCLCVAGGRAIDKMFPYAANIYWITPLYGVWLR